jgi:hypothetical protein
MIVDMIKCHDGYVWQLGRFLELAGAVIPRFETKLEPGSIGGTFQGLSAMKIVDVQPNVSAFLRHPLTRKYWWVGGLFFCWLVVSISSPKPPAPAVQRPAPETPRDPFTLSNGSTYWVDSEGCVRAKITMDQMRDMGFANVWEFKDWIKKKIGAKCVFFD